MEFVGNVQKKISCVFETVVVEEHSTKRSHQTYKVVAGENMKAEARAAFDSGAFFPSEKLDGTCVLIRVFDDKPWIWARHDRKPNKVADRKFKKFQTAKRAWEAAGRPDGGEPKFEWDASKDFKDVPCVWVPADGVNVVNGFPQPDVHGHIPGWVPVEAKSRQHCWHSQTVEFDSGLALVLQPDSTRENHLEIAVKPLADLLDCTMELIGSNVNANPYRIGSKQRPLHFLVRHGILPVHSMPQVNFADLKTWFADAESGQVEGIVWHCKSGQLFKLHRHHLELKWPVATPRLTLLPVNVNVRLNEHPDADFGEKETFRHLYLLKGQSFQSISQIAYEN